MINKKRSKAQNPYQDFNKTYDINERFVDACENGDYPTVQKVLDSIKDFNIDVTDNLGRTALRLAVENEHLEVVQALLEKCDSSKLKEALLLAIFLGHTQIAESILMHPKYKVFNDKKFQNGDSDSFWQTPSSDDAQFPPDITPLILAAQYNRTEIVQILLLNGDRITKPHDFHCKCNECLNRFKFDSLRHAQSRLNAYRGLTSEAYISLASIDPILTAFELARELRILSAKEKYFKNEYLHLADNLSGYVCKLLNNVRGHDELEIVLNKAGKESEEKYKRLARLDLAIKYEEKPFVAHSNCQQKLVEIWYTGIRRVSKMNQFLVLLLLFVFIFLFPFLSMYYIIFPNSKIGKFMSQPFIKFSSHTITYMIFIILIILSSVLFSSEISSTSYFSDFLNDTSCSFDNYTSYLTISKTNQSSFSYEFILDDFHMRKNTPSFIDLLITLYVIGFVWQEFKKIFYFGFRDYFNSWNNIVNAIQLVLYISSFGLKYYTMYLVRLYQSKVSDPKYWSDLMRNIKDVNYQRDLFETIYWLNNDRFFWVPLDPINMAEGFFAIANLFSFTRICFLLPVNQDLGPLQISLGNMIADTIKFLLIFLIICLGFTFSLNNLYWYYQASIRGQVQAVVSNETLVAISGKSGNYQTFATSAETNFGSFLLSFKSAFWSLFGLGNPDYVIINDFRNQLTENFGTVLYGSYHIAAIIVLLNMLVASMTQSFEKILAESDIEWKYAKSKLFMEYIKEGSTLAVPFNLIPTPQSLVRFYKWSKTKMVKSKYQNESRIEEIEINVRPGRNNNNNNGAIPPAGPANHVGNGHLPNGKMKNVQLNNQNESLTYIKVMQRIVKRLLLHKQRENDDFNDLDFDELKQDLQMIRYEMNNDSKKAREEIIQVLNHINLGIKIIGEEVFKSDINTDLAKKFKEFKSTEFAMKMSSKGGPMASSDLTQIRINDESLLESSNLPFSSNSNLKNEFERLNNDQIIINEDAQQEEEEESSSKQKQDLILNQTNLVVSDIDTVVMEGDNEIDDQNISENSNETSMSKQLDQINEDQE